MHHELRFVSSTAPTPVPPFFFPGRQIHVCSNFSYFHVNLLLFVSHLTLLFGEITTEWKARNRKSKGKQRKSWSRASIWSKHLLLCNRTSRSLSRRSKSKFLNRKQRMHRWKSNECLLRMHIRICFSLNVTCLDATFGVCYWFAGMQVLIYNTVRSTGKQNSKMIWGQRASRLMTCIFAKW